MDRHLLALFASALCFAASCGGGEVPAAQHVDPPVEPVAEPEPEVVVAPPIAEVRSDAPIEEPPAVAPSIDLGICARGGIRSLRSLQAARVAPAFRGGPNAVSFGDHAGVAWVDDESRHVRWLEIGAGGAAIGEPRDLASATSGASGSDAARGARCSAVVTTEWRTTEDRSIALVRLCPGEEPVEIEIARGYVGTAIVAARGDRFGVAFTEGAGIAATALHFAVVETDGTLTEALAAEGAALETMSLVATDDGWLLVGGRSSLSSRAGLVAYRFDRSGRLTASGEIARGPVGAEMGAPVVTRAPWGFLVAFSRGEDLATVRLDARGAPLGSARIAAAWRGAGRDDIGTGQYPDAIAPLGDAFLVAYERRTGTERYETYVVATDGERASAPRRLGARAIGVALVPTSSGVLAIEHDAQWTPDAHLQAYAVCDAPPLGAAMPEVPDAHPGDPCDPTVLGMAIDRYAPAREVFELAALGDELAVAYAVGDERHLARMTRDGIVRWSRPLAATRGLPASVAVSADEIAAVFVDGGAMLSTFAHDGTPRVVRAALQPDGFRACVAPLDDGWAIVATGLEGSRFVRVALDGSIRSARSAPAAMECALAPASGGLVLATSRPGDVSETNFLYTLLLDANGAALAPEHEVERRFARSPSLLAIEGGFALAWADPLAVDQGEGFRAIRLAPDGAPIDEPREFGWNRGTGGWGVVPGSGAPILLHASRVDWIEQPLCPDHPRPYPPPMPPLPHERFR